MGGLLIMDPFEQSIVGNFANYSLHMDGLCKMVEIRGGFLTLDDGLRAKILR